MCILLRVSQANEVPNISHVRSHRRYSNCTKTFKKRRKRLKINFYEHFRLDESFKTMSQVNPTVTLFDGQFLGKYVS